MHRLSAEPPVLETMEDLLAMAAQMEQEAIEGYTLLREKMQSEGREELVAVFERLIAEEVGHLGQVVEWEQQTGLKRAVTPPPTSSNIILFDAEGTDLIPAEALNAYRTFSMAVRNEERAFIFWSYVAAHAPTGEIRQAAERMASEELTHIATLRRERRRAFHSLRRVAEHSDPARLADLEERFAVSLDKLAETHTENADPLRAFALQAQNRRETLQAQPFSHRLSPLSLGEAAIARPATLCGIILDCYLEFAEHEKSEENRNLAQKSASQLIQCLSHLRGLYERD